MTNSDRLLKIISDLDTFAVQLRIEGQDTWADTVRKSLEELMWLFHDMTEYEE